MQKQKQWGIRINGQWVEHDNAPSVYYLKREAEEDASDFNLMRKKGDDPYKVKEIK